MKSKAPHRLVRTCSRAACLLAGALAAILATHSASATVYFWDTVTTGTWATGANWSDNAVSGGTTGAVPSSTDTAFFNQSSLNGNKIVQLDAPASIAGITFSDANAKTTSIYSSSATSQALTIGAGGIRVVAGNGVTIGNAANPAPVVLGATQAWTNLSGSALTVVNGVDNGGYVLTVAGTNSTTLNGVLSNGGLTKTGSGTLTLTGANNHLGDTTLSGGTLNINNPAALGTGTFTIASSTTIDNTTGAALTLSTNNPITWSGSFTFTGSKDLNLGSGAVAMTTSLTVTTNNAGNLTVGGDIAGGSNGLTKTGSGTLTLGGTNSYNGQTNVYGGTLTVSGTRSTYGNGTYLRNGSTMNISGTETITGAEVILNSNTATTCTVNVSGTWNLAGCTLLIGHEGTATGVLNILTGGIVNSGTNDFRIGNTSSFMPTGIVTMSPGSQLNLDSSAATTGFVLANAGTNTGVKGTLNLDGGVITTARPVRGGIGTATFNFNGGTLKAGLTSTSFFSLGSNGASRANVRNGGAIIDTDSFDISIPQALLHSNIGGDATTDGGLTKNGEATLTLTGISTYTGNTNVSAGTLALAATGGLKFVVTDASNNKVTGAGSATLDGSFTIDTSTVSLTSGTWTLVDVATKTFGTTFTVAGAGWSETADVWTKNDGNRVWTFTEATGILAVTSPYGDWAAAKGLTSLNNGPGMDPDNDGRSNLAEFAFDGDPRSGVNDGKVVGKVATLPSDGSKVLTLTLPVRTGATFSGATEQVSAAIDGIVYTIQGSGTLDAASWNLVIAEVIGSDALGVRAGLPTLSAGWTYRTFRSPGTVTDGDPRDFLHVKVTQP